MPTIYLDMDGVLVDFFTAALRVHGQESLADAWPKGVRDMAKVMGLTQKEFWRPIEAQGEAYWEELEPLPWMHELVDIARAHGTMSILTSPHLHPACHAGKYTWMQKHLAKGPNRPFSEYVLTRAKHRLALRDSVLVDDKESHVEAFREAGGHAILFPQIWNRHAHHPQHVDHPAEYVARKLATIVDRLSNHPEETRR